MLYSNWGTALMVLKLNRIFEFVQRHRILPHLDSGLITRWAILSIIYHVFVVPFVYLFQDIIWARLGLINERLVLDSLHSSNYYGCYWNYVTFKEPFLDSPLVINALYMIRASSGVFDRLIDYGAILREDIFAFLSLMLVLVSVIVVCRMFKHKTLIRIVSAVLIALYWVLYLRITFYLLTLVPLYT
jgi:hypothetical protein